MSGLLQVSRAIDGTNAMFGRVADWLVLFAALISAYNAAQRYLFNVSSNAWLEIQWYMFAGMVLLGAAYTLKLNEHVRVDLVYSSVSDRARLWIDIFGILFFLLPAMVIIAWMSWPFFTGSYLGNEGSSNAGGLLRWPVKLLMPLGFGLVALQGISELIKRVAALQGRISVETKYEKPLQ